MQTRTTDFCFPLLYVTLALLATQLSCRGTSTGFQHQARAEIIESAEQLIGGPAAEGRPGDILIHNAWIRGIIQVPREQNAPDGAFGGNLIDLDVARRPFEPGQDRLRELVVWFGPGHGAKPDTVRIADDGAATGQAIVEVIAHDVRLRTVDRALEQAGQSLSALPGDASAELTVDIRTRYILGADDRAILIETSLINQGGEAIQIPVGDLISLRPDLQQFVAAGSGHATGRPSPGFAPWSDRVYNETSLVGWTNSEISYVWLPFAASPYEHPAATACALATPVRVLCAAGASFSSSAFSPVTGAWDDPGDGNGTWLNVPPRGTGMGVWRRYIAVSEDGIGSALANVLRDREYVDTTVTVVDPDGAPVQGAEVAIATNVNGAWYPWLHGWTNDAGIATFPLNKGLWRAYAWARGRSVSSPTGPDRQDFEIATVGADPVAFALTVGRESTLEIFTQDQARHPLPARVALLGDAPVAEISAAGQTATTTLHPFLAGPERLIPEVARANVIAVAGLDASALPDPLDVVAVLDTDGSGAGRVRVPAGRYVALAWRGADYGATATVVDVAENDTTRALLTVPQIADRTTHLWADLLRSTAEGEGVLERRDVNAAAAAAGLGFVGVADEQIVTPLEYSGDAVTSIGGVLLSAPRLGRLALFTMEPAPLPLRSKPIPAAGETVTPAVARGGAPSDIDPDSGQWIAPVDQLAVALTRATTPRATLLVDPAVWLDDLGINIDFAAGEASALSAEDPALWTDAWTALLTRPRDVGLDGVWRDVNVAFALWNLGRPAVLVAAGHADRDATPQVAAPVATRIAAPAGAAATEVIDGIDKGNVVIANQVDLNLLVQATLWDLSATPTVLDTFGPAGPGELLVIRRDNFPASGTAYALDLTATITVRGPEWARLERVELFDTAAFVTATTVDLSSVTAAAWPISDAAWASAVTTSVIPVGDQGDGSKATSGRYVELSWTWTRRITASTLTAADTTDLWFAARAWGTTGLFPVAVDAAGRALPPFAFANPVYVDLGGEAGLPFDDAWDGPCEAAASPTCPN